MNEAKPIWESFLWQKRNEQERKTKRMPSLPTEQNDGLFRQGLAHAPFRRENGQGNHDQGNGDRQTPVETLYPVEDDFRKDITDQGAQGCPGHRCGQAQHPEFQADLIAKVAEGGSEYFKQVQFPSLPVSFFAGNTEEDD